VVNVGAYRIQVQDDGAAASINMEPGKHGAQHVRAWFAKEGRAPVAVSLGHHPVFLLVAGTEVPLGISEFDYAGAILGEPVPVVKCPDTGLPVPAESELAFEGWLYPDRTRPEGPFGEWTGYYSGGVAPVLTAEVTGLFHRSDPVSLGAPPGKPPHDYSYMRSVMKSAMAADALISSGLPGVTSTMTSTLVTLTKSCGRWQPAATRSGTSTSCATAGAAGSTRSCCPASPATTAGRSLTPAARTNGWRTSRPWPRRVPIYSAAPFNGGRTWPNEHVGEIGL
jgi:3-octaprenyl-4-hydroxybenzoate carboxy-lyase